MTNYRLISLRRRARDTYVESIPIQKSMSMVMGWQVRPLMHKTYPHTHVHAQNMHMRATPMWNRFPIHKSMSMVTGLTHIHALALKGSQWLNRYSDMIIIHTLHVHAQASNQACTHTCDSIHARHRHFLSIELTDLELTDMFLSLSE